MSQTLESASNALEKGLDQEGESKILGERVRLSSTDLEILRLGVKLMRLTSKPHEMTVLQEDYLKWYNLVALVVVELVAQSTAKKPPHGSERVKHQTKISALWKLADECFQKCPLKTLQHIPESGTLAGKSLLYYLAEHGIEMPESFLAKLTLRDLNWQHKETGDTALIIAATHDHHTVVQSLVEAGAACEIKNLKDKLASETPGIFARENSIEDRTFGVMTRRILSRVETLFGLAQGLNTGFSPPAPITETNLDSLLGDILLLGGRLTQRNQAGQTPYDVAVAAGKLSAQNLKKLEPEISQSATRVAAPIPPAPIPAAPAVTFVAPSAVGKSLQALPSSSDQTPVTSKEDLSQSSKRLS